MFNCIVVNENSILNNKIRMSCSADSDIMLSFFENSKDAVSYLCTNNIGLAILSLSMPLMNGDELAEYIADKDINTLFIFIYDDVTFELAAQLYNRYDRSSLIHEETFTSSGIFNLIKDKRRLFELEDVSERHLDEVRRKEDTYKNAVRDMKNVLRARTEGYHDIVKLFDKSINFILAGYSGTSDEADDSLTDILYSYINSELLTDKDEDFDICALTERFSDRDSGRIYDIKDNCSGNYDNEAYRRLLFSIRMLSALFCIILNKYNIRFELRDNEKLYQLDFIFLKTGLPDSMKYISSISDAVTAGGLIPADKATSAENEKVRQIRMYFLKKGQR